MKAIVVKDQAAGTAGMTLVERPEPRGAINDVVVQVHASGFVPTELTWPSTWAGAVGSMATQLGREAGAYVIGTGRAADRQTVLDFGAKQFVDLENDVLEDVGAVDLVFDVIGGDIGKRSAALIRAGGTLVSIVGPPDARPTDGLAVDFVVESDRAQLGEIVQRVRDGRLRTNIGKVSALDDAVAAFNTTKRNKGKTIIRVRR
jgi:NADPH:quinone reductase-like Zn-dependent oxidoreductase